MNITKEAVSAVIVYMRLQLEGDAERFGRAGGGNRRTPEPLRLTRRSARSHCG